MTLPLSPYLRAIQQSWWFHFVVAAVIAGGGTAFTCFGTTNEFSMICLKSGLIVGGIYLFGSLQHGPGSASFKPDGTDNKPVAEVVKAQAVGQRVAVVTDSKIVADPPVK